MANLKLDLLNKLRNEKYFDELELVRLAQDPNMNYLEKIGQMQKKLERIAIVNAELDLTEQYFKEPAAPQPQVQQPVQPVQPQGQVHNGQTHGE